MKKIKEKLVLFFSSPKNIITAIVFLIIGVCVVSGSVNNVAQTLGVSSEMADADRMYTFHISYVDLAAIILVLLAAVVMHIRKRLKNNRRKKK